MIPPNPGEHCPLCGAKRRARRPKTIMIAEEAQRRYADGEGLREIAAALGCSHEWVRQQLLGAGIKTRPRGRGGRRAPELSPMAEEVFDDLDDKFGAAGATLAELSEWLGASPPELRAALGLLIAAGWATIRADRYFVHTPPDGAITYADPTTVSHSVATRGLPEENEPILQAHEGGETFRQIAERTGRTRSAIAGIVARARRAGAQ